MRTRTLVVATFLLAACSDGLGPVPSGRFGLVSGGFRHTCGLLGSGAAYCWGFNGSLQLGSGAANDRDTLPRAVAGALRFTRIDAGQFHTCAITTSGDAYCWGSSNDGALGSGIIQITPDPVPVAGGLNQDTAVTSAGTPILVAGGRTYTAITSGDYHMCAIAVGGAAYCWGEDGFGFGALGTGDSTPHNTPTAVAGGHLFKAIDGGDLHTCGLTTGGDVYCWGWGAWGQLGNGARGYQPAPVKVGGGRTYTAVSVGANHSCALASGGQLFCWGNNGSSQLAGTATETCPLPPSVGGYVPCTSTPIVAAGGQKFRALSAGFFHTCAIGAAGGAYCWGANNDGQVGNGAAGTTVTAVARVSDPPGSSTIAAS